MKKYIDSKELDERIELNYKRLLDGDYYHIENVFAPLDYDWYGDKEGRALLAFACHYKMSGRIIPCMTEMLGQIEAHLNSDGYFGPIFTEEIHEQQLSGHSWLLRGLCEYYDIFRDEKCLEIIEGITQNLYLTRRGRFGGYPITRDAKEIGDVSGSSADTLGEWILSSDVGCAFMSIDGLSHVYAITKDGRIKELLDEMISVYLEIDKVALKVQTHCTLTAARGMLRMYAETLDKKYFDGAAAIADLYFNGGGMSATYQNLNWWARPRTWTEPCAIIDSLMLAAELYKLTGDEKYRSLAARIYHNGLATAQRSNGGAGTDTVVLEGIEDTLRAQLYEAYFCCTMRLAEGLWYVQSNKDLLYAHVDGEVKKRGGIYADGDIIYAEVKGGAEAYAECTVLVDGLTLSPIIKYYKVPQNIIESSEQRIIFSA